MRVFIKADHPIFKRIDEYVESNQVQEKYGELVAAGYENISMDPWVPLTNSNWCGNIDEHNFDIEDHGQCLKCKKALH